MIQFFAELLAQVVPVDVNWKTIAVVYGPMGAMLFWFANWGVSIAREVISELKVLGHRLNGMQRVMLLDLIERDVRSTPKLKSFAEKELERLEREEEVKEMRKQKRQRGFFHRGGDEE